jgi:fucose permease
MRWSIFICGSGLLCLAAWIDNMRGPLLPAITALLSLDNAAAGLIMSLGNLVAMATTWLLMPLLNRWSLKQVGLGVLIYTIVVCAAASYVDNSSRMFLWGALLGGSISTMGSLSNLYVQSGMLPAIRGQMMSALHSFYGLTSFFAPWLAGFVLTKPQNWPVLFTSVAPAAAVLAIFIYLRGPKSENRLTRRSQAQPLTLSPIHILTISVLISYVVGEVLTSTWMTSFLVHEQGLSIKDASFYTSMFFAAMLVTRIACGIIAKPRWHRLLIWSSMATALICFVIGRLTGWLWLLPLAGLFGPFFPLYVTWVSLRFPERDRSMIIWMLSGMQAAMSVMNYLTGKLADVAGFSVAFWLPACMMVLTMILLKTLEIKEQHPTHSKN